jgi:hypothetical protein
MKIVIHLKKHREKDRKKPMCFVCVYNIKVQYQLLNSHFLKAYYSKFKNKLQNE